MVIFPNEEAETIDKANIVYFGYLSFADKNLKGRIFKNFLTSCTYFLYQNIEIGRDVLRYVVFYLFIIFFNVGII